MPRTKSKGPGAGGARPGAGRPPGLTEPDARKPIGLRLHASTIEALRAIAERDGVGLGEWVERAVALASVDPYVAARVIATPRPK